MSNSGPLNAPVRLPAVNVLAAGDRKAAYYLGMVRGTTHRAADQLAGGRDPAEVLGELLGRLDAMVDEGERSLDPAARAAGLRVAGHHMDPPSETMPSG